MLLSSILTDKLWQTLSSIAGEKDSKSWTWTHDDGIVRGLWGHCATLACKPSRSRRPPWLYTDSFDMLLHWYSPAFLIYYPRIRTEACLQLTVLLTYFVPIVLRPNTGFWMKYNRDLFWLYAFVFSNAYLTAWNLVPWSLLNPPLSKPPPIMLSKLHSLLRKGSRSNSLMHGQTSVEFAQT